MAGGERIQIRLRLGELPEEDLVVLRFEGREGLCEPFVFEVEFVTAGGESLDLDGLLGQPALLTVERPTGEVRFVQGEALRLQMTGVAAMLPRYSVRIEPRLSRLARVAKSRIFQEKAVPDVLLEVLDEHGVSARSALAGGYPDVEFLAQYRETDLAFVARLLERDGAWFRFEHADGEHTVVFGDGTSAYVEAASLPFRATSEQSEGTEHVAEIARVRRVTSGKATRRDFDFARPALDLTAKAGDGELEVYEYPGGYTVGGEGKRLVNRRLEDLRFGEDTYEGRGNALCMQPGSVIEITEHRDDTLNGKRMLVRVTHRGEQLLEPGGITPISARYEARFVAIDAEREYRPRRVTPRPRIAGIQTATVAGQSGEEVWTDEHGRIKVQFHWDRDGRSDQRSSCFVRVAQAWAGAGIGASFLPRIGQEVVVRFLEGDPDRPVVTGAVYNGTHPPPANLPNEKTQSALRSDSSPGSGGFNELRFEDAQGAELISIHAQKDEFIGVGNDKVQSVRLNESLEVKGDRTQKIKGNEKLRVDGDDVREVKGSQTLDVKGERKITVGASETVGVALARAVNVLKERKLSASGAITESVGAAAMLNVVGGLMINVGGAVAYAVGKHHSTNVKEAAIEAVGATRDELVEKNKVQRTKADMDLNLDGEASWQVAGDWKQDVGGSEEIEITEKGVLMVKAGTLEAETLTISVNGKEAFSLKKSGQVKVSAATITFDAGGKLTFGAKQVKKITGKPPPSKKAEVKQLKKDDEPKKVVRVTFSGVDGQPALADLQFKLKLPDGSTKEGAVSASGEIAVADVTPGKVELELTGLEEQPKKAQGK